LVVGGSTGVSLSEVRLKATNESIDITRLILRVADGGLTGTASGDFNQVSKIVLKLDGAVVGNPAGYSPAADTHTINFSRGDLTIPEGVTGKKLSILGDIAQIGTNQPGTTNADIKVGLNGKNALQATGNSSNATASETYNDSTGSPVIIHKAVPQIVMEIPANKLGATSVLTRAKITAVGNKIGIHRLSFLTTSSTAVELTNGYYQLASCSGCDGLAAGTVLTATQALGTDDVVANTSGGLKRWTAVISGGSHGKSYLGIASGVTATVDFYATVGMTTNADSVSTRLLGDTATTTTNNDGQCATTTTFGCTAASFASREQGSFVWSDLSSDDSNSAAALTSKQWFNGYYVSGLGPTATSTPITVGE
jgi:hypothetical protein